MFAKATDHPIADDQRSDSKRNAADHEPGKDAVRAKSATAIDAALDALESRLAGRTFAAGESMTTSDFFLLVMLKWAGNVDPMLLRSRPSLSACADKLRSMPFHSRAFGVDAA